MGCGSLCLYAFWNRSYIWNNCSYRSFCFNYLFCNKCTISKSWRIFSKLCNNYKNDTSCNNCCGRIFIRRPLWSYAYRNSFKRDGSFNKLACGSWTDCFLIWRMGCFNINSPRNKKFKKKSSYSFNSRACICIGSLYFLFYRNKFLNRTCKYYWNGWRPCKCSGNKTFWRNGSKNNFNICNNFCFGNS